MSVPLILLKLGTLYDNNTYDLITSRIYEPITSYYV